MPKYTWESLREHPADLEKLINLVKKMDNYLVLDKKHKDPRLMNFVNQLTALRKDPNRKDAQEIFDRGMEMLGDRVGFFTAEYKEKKAEEIQQMKDLDGYQELEDQLTLAKPGTLGYLAEQTRSQFYDTMEGDINWVGTEKMFFTLATIHNEANGQKNWKTMPASEKLITGGPAKDDIAREYYSRAGTHFLENTPPEELTELVMTDTDGKKIDEFLYRKYIEDSLEMISQYQHDGVKQKDGKGRIFYHGYPQISENAWNKLSPEEQATYHEDQRKAHQKEADDYAADYVSEMLTCRVISKLKPEKGKVFWDVGRQGQRIHDAYMKLAPGFVASMPREDLGRLMCESKTASTLDRRFRQYILTRQELPDGLPDFMQPTAKERIEDLQRRIKSKNTEPEEKRRCAIEIIAVREAVNAQRGGAGLDTKLLRSIQEQVEALQQNLKQMLDGTTHPDKEFDKLLLADATSGHGGKMTENYRKYYAMHLNKQSTALNGDGGLPQDLDDTLMPTAKSRIEAMQARLRVVGELYDGKALNAEIARSVAGILAARENVNAQRGGKGLKKKLTNAKGLAERTQELAEKLSLLDGETLGMLRDQALSGHGGEMKKTFESDEITNRILKAMVGRFGEQERKAKHEQAVKEGAQNSLESWKKRQKEQKDLYQDALKDKGAKLANLKTPEERDACLSEILYLTNTMRKYDDPGTLNVKLRDESVKAEAEKLRRSDVFEKYYKRMASKEAIKEAEKGNPEKLADEWASAVRKEKEFTKKMEEQQKMLSSRSPQKRDAGMAGILYLNDMAERFGPASQDKWMNPEAMEQAVSAIEKGEVFQKNFKQSLTEEAVKNAKEGKVEMLLHQWNNVALKEASFSAKRLEQTDHELKRSKTFQGPVHT